MSTPNPEASTRGLQIAAVGVIAAAFIGFFVGIKPAVAPLTPQSAPKSDAPLDVVSAPSWSEMRNARAGGLVEAELETLPRVVDRKGPIPVDDAAKRARAIDSHMAHRAYDGAPPTIPHPVPQRGALPCLTCHGEGLIIGDTIVAAISHPHLTACTQCHAPSVGGPPALSPPLPSAVAANSFVGMVPGDGGQRAWFGAPPEIPHRTWMRDNCLACHSAHAEPGLRSTHAERQSCTQCHAPSAALEQWPNAMMGGGR